MSDESLFLLAQEKATPAERSAFLDEVCAGDVEQRRRIERLLGAADRPVGILERGPELTAADVPFPESSLKADRLFAGRYKLRQRLGEGGMGEVWVADQIEPVQRRVALKVVRLGYDASKMLARFDQERQALAVMDHPNIAEVLDAGVDEAGRPYFVMELIKGVAITEYCDVEKLSLRQRIELFIPVCHAVQHAHQKGIIHRDLKPSNILVGLYDDRAFADDPRNYLRFNAACSAMKCANAKGLNPPMPVDRPEYRKQALGLLSAELATIRKLPTSDREFVFWTMQDWFANNDLAAVRDLALTAALPEAERDVWNKFWTDVRELSASTAPSEREPTPKAGKGE
jgi:Protein kinase domain